MPTYDRILVPLDSSPFAEEVIPYALFLARSSGAKLTPLRVIDTEAAAQIANDYIQSPADCLQAEGRVPLSRGDVAGTILDEMHGQGRTLVAMTTPGRTGLIEAISGSVARAVVRDAGRAVVLYRPRGAPAEGEVAQARAIDTVVAALDSSDFCEEIVPHAVEVTKSLKAALTLVQVVPTGDSSGRAAPRGDVLESSYIHRNAQETSLILGMQVD